MVPEGQSLTQPVVIPGGQPCPHPLHLPPTPTVSWREFRARLVVSGQGIPAGFTGTPTVEEALQTVKDCKSLERSLRPAVDELRFQEPTGSPGVSGVRLRSRDPPLPHCLILFW